MKTIFAFLLVVWLVPGLKAQPAPANSPSATNTADREERLRRALDEAYAQVANTNLPTGVTNPASPDLKPPLGPTNRASRLTNALAAFTNAPPSINNAATPAAGPSRNLTNVPVAGAVPPAVAPPFAGPRAATNVTRAPGRPVLPRLPAAQAPAPTVPSAAAVPPDPAAPIPSVPPAPGTATFTALTTNVADKADEEIFPPGLIKFQEADLIQVLDIYQELTGRTVMRPASLAGAKMVTIRSQTPLTRREAIQALDSILSLNGITMIPQGEKFVKAVQATQAATEAREFNDLPHEDLPNSGSLVTHVVQLSNALPRDAALAMQPFAKLPNSILALDNSGIIILRDYAENVKRMLELLDKIDVAPLQEFEPVVIPIKYALAGDIAQVLSSLTAGGGGATTVGGQPVRTGLSPAPGRPGTVGGAGGIPGQPGYNPQGAATGSLTQPGGTRSSFQDRLRSIVNRAAGGDIVVLGQTKIIADERTNSLLIFASKQDIETIKDIIEKLDVVLAQVLIEAIIMEVALGNTLDYGISYLQRGHKIGDLTGSGAINNGQNILQAATNSLPSGFSYFGTFKGDFDLALEAVAGDSRINVLSRPRIQTSHAVEANLFVGETRPYVTGTYFGGFQGQGAQSQYQQLQIGITLSVLPLINPDGLVVMDIRQKIQSVGDNVLIDGNPVPITTDREANAKVAVRDRETIMLGGFISNTKNVSKSGVPILKDIPLLGALFRSTSDARRRNELIVLIRPTVLPTPEDAAVTAAEERSMLPGILQAEKEVTDAERKRQQKSAKALMKREGFSNR